MMLRVLLALAFVGFASAQCSFSGNGIMANWTASNGQVNINFQNSKIANNQWTAMAFGTTMDNLEIIIFKVQNGKPSVVTGHTSQFGPPTTIDKSANVAMSNLSYRNGMLSGSVTRPVTLNSPRSSNLNGCTQWNFVGSSGMNPDGSVQKHQTMPSPMNVCTNQCQRQG
ncbi:unnamed protein product, partial [Mesorhabditis spiculigera]